MEGSSSSFGPSAHVPGDVCSKTENTCVKLSQDVLRVLSEKVFTCQSMT